MPATNNTRLPSLHRRTVKIAACALLISGALAMSTAAAHAQQEAAEAATPDFGFSGTVTANGVRQRLFMPSFLAVGDTITDLGVPVAQAVLNSGGVSEAFASNPYPGEIVITGGDLVGGATGMPNQLPPYPAYVKASYPNQPEAAMSLPGFSLAAIASPRQARGDGSIQASPDSSLLDVAKSAGTADVRVNDAGEIEADGVSIVKGIDIGGGLLTIGELRSELHGILDSDGKPKWKSALTITGATVAGTAVVLTEDGLSIAGQNNSISRGPAEPLLELLEEQGIELQVVESGPAPGDETTMTSRALRVVLRVPSLAIAPATEVHLEFGATTGRLVAGSPGSLGSFPDASSNAPAESPNVGSPPAPSGQGGGDVGSALGSTVASPGSQPTAPGLGEGDSASSEEAGAVSSGDLAAPIGERQAFLVARDLQSEVQLPYILLAFGGFAIVGCVTSWRRWIAPTVSRSIDL